MGKDYSHRDLCCSTSGILKAYVKMSQNKHNIDEETAVSIAEMFYKKHEELGAETPQVNPEELIDES